MGQHFISTYGALVNITVDDQGVDPTTGNFISRTSGMSLGQNCNASCDARPDASQAFNGTWLDTTFDPSRNDGHNIPQNATFSFTGSAVYVYGIQSQSVEVPLSDADIFFYVDGTSKGNYAFSATGPQNAYTYDQPLFYTDNLNESHHTLVIQNGRIGGGLSLMLLDSIVYTRDDVSEIVPSTTSGISATAPSLAATSITSAPMHGLTGSARTAVIATAIVVPTLAALALVALVFHIHRRRRPVRPASQDEAHPAKPWNQHTPVPFSIVAHVMSPPTAHTIAKVHPSSNQETSSMSITSASGSTSVDGYAKYEVRRYAAGYLDEKLDNSVEVAPPRYDSVFGVGRLQLPALKH
ncbi:hypothetical protein PsYK624_054270 [Phanerochaete sordida]|uniref:Uncharacterized protein n=1 Tax=Phanerochaete sordida TaxID=48140 RepID=A0A9P3G528_9APHY|nr:hypothetical protein PsYK624_054270 [Phanerochaete sordida]